MLKRSGYCLGLLGALACAAAQSPPALQVTLLTLDHPSGLYQSAQSGLVSLQVENPTAEPLRLEGPIEFGLRDGQANFKLLALTPITASDLPPGTRVKLDLPVTFERPGRYGLRWQGRWIGPPLTCLFRPRGTEHWMGLLPAESLEEPRGFLSDLLTQRGWSWVFWDNWLLGEEPAVQEQKLKVLAEELGDRQLVIRLHRPAQISAPRYEAHVATLLQTFKGRLRGLALDTESLSATDYQRLYLRLYAQAKETDPGIYMLGTGSAARTRQWLCEARPESLTPYLDALGVGADRGDFWEALTLKTHGAKPLWLLPGPAGQAHVPPVLALAMGASRMVLEQEDLGFTAHALGQVESIQTLNMELPPFVCVFQGPGYAVAAVAGLGAGAPQDELWTALARQLQIARSTPTPAAPSTSWLEVADSDGGHELVDGSGQSVETRFGDLLNIPLDAQVRYLLADGPAEDLLAALRTAETKGMPLVELQPQNLTSGEQTLRIRLRSAEREPISGVVRLLRDPKRERTFGPLGSGQEQEILLSTQGQSSPITLEVLVQGRPVALRVNVELGTLTGH